VFVSWEALSAISDFLAAIVVIVTLGYLAVQIRQNTKAISGASIDSITNHAFQELRWSAELTDLCMKSESDPDSLSELEHRKLVLWGIASLRNRQDEYFQWRQGSLSDEVWRASESILPGILGGRVVGSWFESTAAKQVLANDFYEYVAEIVRESDQDCIHDIQSYGRDQGEGAA
jgi:hypothetical protein